MLPLDTYPEFDYKAKQINKFMATAGIVTILLIDGTIVHHTPKRLSEFLKWLKSNGIKDIGRDMIFEK